MPKSGCKVAITITGINNSRSIKNGLNEMFPFPKPVIDCRYAPAFLTTKSTMSIRTHLRGAFNIIAQYLFHGADKKFVRGEVISRDDMRQANVAGASTNRAMNKGETDSDFPVR